MSGMKITGLDKLQKQLKQMEKGAKELERTKQVAFTELFTPLFMRKYTSFSSFDEFLQSGGFKDDSQEEFEAIPDEPFDSHVANVTTFTDWQDMLGKATELYALKKLGL